MKVVRRRRPVYVFVSVEIAINHLQFDEMKIFRCCEIIICAKKLKIKTIL